MCAPSSVLVAEQRALRLTESDDLLLDKNAEDAVQDFLGAPILSPLGSDGMVLSAQIERRR